MGVDALWVDRRNVRKRKKDMREYRVRYKYWNKIGGSVVMEHDGN